MRLAKLGFIAALLLTSPQVSAEVFTFHHERVLGTSCEISVVCESQAIARSGETLALREIDRLRSVLSNHADDSELKRLCRSATVDQEMPVSNDLGTVLRRAEHWRQLTSGAFDVRASGFDALWRTAAAAHQLPSTAERLQLASTLEQAPYALTDRGFLWKTPAAISLDGLAKGYILDRVVETLVADTRIRGACVNIGGDLRKSGEIPLQVAITDPKDPSENAAPLSRIRIDQDVALATSGNYRRGYQIQGRRYSHIIDPRSGLPVDHILSASVIAEHAIDADALATALSVMPAELGLELVASLPQVECSLVLHDGGVLCSDGWPAEPTRQRLISQQDTKSEKLQGLIVDFTLLRAKGERYRRPYVAVWLEDKDGFPVKTAILWLQIEQPGPRWHRDLTRWYRNDRLRKVVEEIDLLETVAGATRGAGEYQAVFDGTDNAGKRLPDGKYTLCLEVAREHGTYQIIREPLVFDRLAIQDQRFANDLIGAMLPSYFQAQRVLSVG